MGYAVVQLRHIAKGFFGEHSAAVIARGCIFVPYERPCGIHKVTVPGVFERLANKELTGGIYILAAYLEQGIALAQRAQTLQLLLGIAGGHICNGAEAQLAYNGEKLVKIGILKALGALISRDALRHIAKVGIGGNGAYCIGKFQGGLYGHAFGVGIYIEEAGIAFENAQKVVIVMGVFGVVKAGLKTGRHRHSQLVAYKPEHRRTASVFADYCLGKPEEHMALRNAAPLLGAAEGKNIAVKIKGYAHGGGYFVYACGHGPVALVALFTVGSHEFINAVYCIVRHPVQRHVCHAGLIGIVYAAVFKGCAAEAYAHFHADGGGQPHNFSGLYKFLRAADGVMIHKPGRAQTCYAGKPYSLARAVRREGIDGVYMIVDIGGGTADIAVISLGGVVVSNSIKVAGDDFDEAIVRFMRKKHNLLIGERTAEEIKINVGTVYKRPENLTMDVRGRNLVTGLPKTVTVTSEETEEALREPAYQIVDAVHNVLERTPPELAADISDRGIVLTGGGSLIQGLEELIEEKTGINTMTAEDPLTAVAIGTGKYIEYLADDDKKSKNK